MAFIGERRPSIIAATGISNQPGVTATPVLPADLVPTKEVSAYRITVIPSGDAVQFGMTINDGSGPYTTLFNDGNVINPGTSYLFTHGVTNAESYNFVMINATGVFAWRKLQVEEVTEGVI